MFNIKVLHTVQFLPIPSNPEETDLLNQILSILNSLNLKTNQFMATVQEQLQALQGQVTDLKAQSVTLQETVDAEQEQINTLLNAATTVNDALKAQIADLEGKVADPTVLDAIKTSLTDIQTGLQATIDDVKSTVPDEETGGGAGSGTGSTPA